MAQVENILPMQNIIVNTTSLGLKESDAMPCSLEGVDADVIIADIIMVPEKTAWLLAAEKKGLKTHAGKHMLDYQRDLIGRFLNIL
jgi:shikimate dehydrogenase